MKLNYIWIFINENLKIKPFKTFREAKDYLINIYDKDIKFIEYNKHNCCHIFSNSWNDEDIYIQKIDLRSFYE
ncbi:MAG: hypothetical protein OQK82_07870 [Candidatus Pacearchaeota archaeon]|nr:hypothetical protein [Candidatus Pacearchaeota archaeon]